MAACCGCVHAYAERHNFRAQLTHTHTLYLTRTLSDTHCWHTQAPGLRALVDALAAQCPDVEVYVCAPSGERSAQSHAITLGRYVRQKEGGGGLRRGGCVEAVTAYALCVVCCVHLMLCRLLLLCWKCVRSLCWWATLRVLLCCLAAAGTCHAFPPRFQEQQR